MLTEARNHSSDTDRKVQQIITENRSWKKKYPSLLAHLEGKSPKAASIAKQTLIVMENQARFMENVSKDKRLESTFTANLGTLVPRVVDLVRIFYPNLIANKLVDIQPLDRMNGEIFIVNPVYSNTAAGVVAGQTVFQEYTDGTYASEAITQIAGTGNGTTATFAGTLATLPVRASSLVFTAGAVVGTDNGQGVITGTGVSGTINYATGAFSVTYTTDPANGVVVTATYRYSSEANPNGIRSLDIQLSTVPITAVPHPLNVSWSTTAELAASANLDLDIPDVLTNLVASFIKEERDITLINSILAAAPTNATLNFDATPPTNYSRLALYASIENKLDYAESQIQVTQGRGGVSWVLCGANAANIWRHAPSFQPSDVVAPIGPHEIGTLRDGTISVIKAPMMATNTFVIGFKGYVIGDAATILAEWIPLYASPVFRSYNLNNYQGLMSLYAIVMNNPNYYITGVVSNYAA
jgi:hypothetical protein